MTEKKTVKIALYLVHSYSAIEFFKKSGRLTFRGQGERKLYLDLKRIKRVQLVTPKGRMMNIVCPIYLIEYETDNVDFYAAHSLATPEEIEAARQRGEVDVRDTNHFVIVTDYDADEPMEWCEIYLDGTIRMYGDRYDPWHDPFLFGDI